jgi:hypothetical protein
MVKAATYLLEYFRQELLRKYQLEKPACKKTLNKIKGPYRNELRVKHRILYEN